jgi:hypothetical protein
LSTRRSSVLPSLLTRLMQTLSNSPSGIAARNLFCRARYCRVTSKRTPEPHIAPPRMPQGTSLLKMREYITKVLHLQNENVPRLIFRLPHLRSDSVANAVGGNDDRVRSYFFSMARSRDVYPRKEYSKRRERKDCLVHSATYLESFNPANHLLVSQYANSSPTLSLEGSAVTSMQPSIVTEMNNRLVQTRPFCQRDAMVVPIAIVTTGQEKFSI